MSQTRITLTREELYEQVWTEPMVHIAKRLGLSDRGLAKLCARYDIPVPPRGWWAKKQHGRAVRRIALPPGGAETELVFHSSDIEMQRPSDPPEVEREKDPAWRIAVPEDLPISHPLIKRAVAAIRQAAREDSKHGAVRWQDRYQAKLAKPGKEHLDIAVSKASVARASRIMQALFSAFERRGFTVRISENGETVVTVLNEPFQISLVERLRQVRVKRTYGTSVDLEPSGRLMLRIGSSYQNAGVADSPSRRVEDSLNRFVANLVRRALLAKHERALHAERQARWEVHEQEERLAQQERDSEGLRRRRLATAVARWSRHQRRIAFVQSVEARIRECSVDARAEQWLEWATDFLKATDPIGELLDDPWPTAPLRAATSMPWHWK
jgi:hypothetical protein